MDNFDYEAFKTNAIEQLKTEVTFSGKTNEESSSRA